VKRYLAILSVLIILVSCSKSQVEPSQVILANSSRFIFDDGLADVVGPSITSGPVPVKLPTAVWAELESENALHGVHNYQAPANIRDLVNKYDGKAGLVLEISAWNSWAINASDNGQGIKYLTGEKEIDFSAFLIFMLHAIPAEFVQLELSGQHPWITTNGYLQALEILKEAVQSVSPSVKILVPVYQLDETGMKGIPLEKQEKFISDIVKKSEKYADVVVYSQNQFLNNELVSTGDFQETWLKGVLSGSSTSNELANIMGVFADGASRIWIGASGRLDQENMNLIAEYVNSINRFSEASMIKDGVVQYAFQNQPPVYVAWNQEIDGKGQLYFDSKGQVITNPSDSDDLVSFNLSDRPIFLTQGMIDAKLSK